MEKAGNPRSLAVRSKCFGRFQHSDTKHKNAACTQTATNSQVSTISDLALIEVFYVDIGSSTAFLEILTKRFAP